MKNIVLLTATFLFLIKFNANAQDNDKMMDNGNIISIDKMIEKKKDNKKQKKILVKFKKQCNDKDRVSVEEFRGYFKITVAHPYQDGYYTGGAECYKVDKKTGKLEMVWHEHPIPLDDVIDEEKEN